MAMDTRIDAALYSLVDATLIPHTTFLHAFKRIEQCFAAMDQSTDPVGLAILGESRTGKSRVLEHFELSHQTSRNSEGVVAPFLRIRVPSKPTVKGLCELLLHKLGDPLFEKGTEITKTLRLIKLLTQAQTRILALDEFQHFYDKTTHRVQHHVSDWLKVLVDEAQIGLVVTGLPSCVSIIQQNEQLNGRFMGPAYLHRFDWTVDEQRNDFVAILAGMQQALAMFELPDLASDQMAFRFYCATGGLIGYLAKILKQAVWDSLDAETTKIPLTALADAFEEAVISDRPDLKALPNPFKAEFQSVLDPALLALVRIIGTPKLEDPPPSRKRKPQAPKAAEVLSAT